VDQLFRTSRSHKAEDGENASRHGGSDHLLRYRDVSCTDRAGDVSCSLQKKVAQGEHIHARISGVYSVGPESSTLDDPACPVASYQSTWVEFDLKTKHNNKKLKELLEHSQRVYLVTEGDFYGPPLPDPKLPETLQKGFPPHWGHLACCRTKLVVHAIREVKAVPTGNAPTMP
jgi:hypothetical protein